jgi:hypothetical protein
MNEARNAGIPCSVPCNIECLLRADPDEYRSQLFRRYPDYSAEPRMVAAVVVTSRVSSALQRIRCRWCFRPIELHHLVSRQTFQLAPRCS